MKITKVNEKTIIILISAYDFSCLLKSLLEVCYGLTIDNFNEEIGEEKPEVEKFLEYLEENFKDKLYPKETWKELRGKISFDDYHKMEESYRKSKVLEIPFSRKQILILKNSLSATISDLKEPIGEFQTRIDVELEDAKGLLKTMIDICSELNS